jgi:hypothetical protein
MVRRLMPTVGCEADAIAFTEEQSGSSSSSGDGAAAAADAGVLLVASADGSYSTGKQQASLTNISVLCSSAMDHEVQFCDPPALSAYNTCYLWYAWLMEASPTLASSHQC